jgi:DNA-binding transcriptional regulator LsrR (DeoR family)
VAAHTARGDVDQTTARVVWYYYVGNLTQQEIADRLGLTRLRVNRIIGQARADGSVRIDVRVPLADCVALAERLRERYGLADAAVLPEMEDVDEQRRVIGEETSAMLHRLLRDGQTLGVGWGRTLRSALARMPRESFGHSWVVSLMGGLTRGSGINTFEVSTQFADALGAECWYLAAPLYCPSEASRDALLAHGELADVMRRAREVDVGLVTCGDMSGRSLIATMPMVREHEAALRARGAVGDLLGFFLDAEGRLVDHALNRQVVALTPAELKTIKVSILASGGVNKVAILRAVLSAGYVNRVVTDVACARALLDPA